MILNDQNPPSKLAGNESSMDFGVIRLIFEGRRAESNDNRPRTPL
jgi:hypothetical protein